MSEENPPVGSADVDEDPDRSEELATWISSLLNLCLPGPTDKEKEEIARGEAPSRLVLFNELVLKAIDDWGTREKTRDQSIRRVGAALVNVQKSLADLRRNLEALEDTFNECLAAEGEEGQWLLASQPEIQGFIDQFPTMEGWIDNQRNGWLPRYGIRGYPGLWELVYGLEFAAQAAGGSFSLTRQKFSGTMLEALDGFRAILHPDRASNFPAAEWSPGVLAAIERALLAGRKAGRQRHHETTEAAPRKQEPKSADVREH